MSEERLTRMEQKLDGLLEGQVELRHHMDVLHEDVLSRIKGATLDSQLVDDKIARGDAAVRAEVNQRFLPVEAVIRGLNNP